MGLFVFVIGFLLLFVFKAIGTMIAFTLSILPYLALAFAVYVLLKLLEDDENMMKSSKKQRKVDEKYIKEEENL